MRRRVPEPQAAAGGRAGLVGDHDKEAEDSFQARTGRTSPHSRSIAIASWQDLRQALILVQPKTVIRWYRRGFSSALTMAIAPE